ncbi:MAG: Rho termination factor N-terminal domain-containing protein, partial [Solirubrobacteraceae bacterium]
MSVVDRSALEASPLADLHAIASELSIDGYRRLRRADLIDAILNRQEGGPGAEGVEPADEAAAALDEETPSAEVTPSAEDGEEADAAQPAESADDEESSAPRRRRGRRGGRGRA